MHRIAVFNAKSNKQIKAIINQLSAKNNLNAFNMYLLKINLSILDKPFFGKSQFETLLDLCATNLIEVIIEADFAEYIYFTGYEVNKKMREYFNKLVDTYKIKHVSVVSHSGLDVIAALKGDLCSINLYNANEVCSDSKQSLHVRSVTSQTSSSVLYAALVNMSAKLQQPVSFEKVSVKYTEKKPEDKTLVFYKTVVDKKIEFVIVNQHESKDGVPCPYILKKKHLPQDIQSILVNLTEIEFKPQTISSIEV